MTTNQILGIINNISYEPDLIDVIIPIEDLNTLKKEILSLRQENDKLNKALIAERKARASAVSEGLKLLADKHIVTRFRDYSKGAHYDESY